MRGLIDNSVNLGGAQTITGVKTVKINKIDLDTIPDSTTTATCFNFVDAKGRLIGRIEAQQDNTNTIFNGLVAKNLVSGEIKTSAVRAGMKADGDATTVAPSDTENKSLVTTVSHKYTDVNNIKFGNGLIIQWGKTDTPNTVTFSTPYTEIPTVLITQNCSSANERNCMVNTITTTSFKTLRYNSESAGNGLEWFSIGI